MYFTQSECRDKMEELKNMSKGSNDYNLLEMQIWYSVGKEIRLTKRGLDVGIKLFKKFRDKIPMTRDELFRTYALGNEAAVMYGDDKWKVAGNEVKDIVMNTYNPENRYIYEYMKKMIHEGYIERNPEFNRRTEFSGNSVNITIYIN